MRTTFAAAVAWVSLVASVPLARGEEADAVPSPRNPCYVVYFRWVDGSQMSYYPVMTLQDGETRRLGGMIQATLVVPSSKSAAGAAGNADRSHLAEAQQGRRIKIKISDRRG